ncbi:MAG TPA: DUF58 domain-containing protein [Gemmataceae bacterium]|jgi:uncharacterized protein (DUF58 family)|nr:DUF58 domain-containing protein [Gemmataceae bacterium]
MVRFDPTELRKFGGLTLLARQIVEGFLTGVHRSPYKGFSVEFAEHRQYTPGDEIRHIDWRAVGKTDRYYVKEYEEETNLKAYLLVDASGSMDYRGSRKATSKFEYAQHVAASLAYLMLHQMDAVGLITLDTKVRDLVPPKANPKHLLRVLTTLEGTTPGGETAMAPLWHELAGHHLKRRGMVFILSDFFDQIDPLMKALQHLRHRNHEVVLLQVLAPEELEFPFKRLTQFRNLETRDQKVLVDTRRLRDDYLANFQRFRDELKERAGKLHVDYHLLRTDQPVDRALGIYLSRRQRTT